MPGEAHIRRALIRRRGCAISAAGSIWRPEDAESPAPDMTSKTRKSVRRLPTISALSVTSALSATAAAVFAALVLAAGAGWSAAALAQAAPPAGCGGPASTTWINFSIEGIRSAEGLVAVTVYPDNSRRFLVKNGSLYIVRVAARAGATRACIFVPAPGVYAIAIYHDADSNQMLNRSGFGFPTEGYGFSNNPTTLAGLPAFRAVRLNIARAGLSSRITMKYP